VSAVRVFAILDLITPTPPESRTFSLVAWVLTVGALIAWQLFTHFTARPSVGTISRTLRRGWVTRWVLLSAWAWLGWHTFVRGAWG
jgi:hypothetical protein